MPPIAQLDYDAGIVMQNFKDTSVDDNTIVVFTTDNGAEVFTCPDGGQTPFAQSKVTAIEGGFRVPCMIRRARCRPARSKMSSFPVWTGFRPSWWRAATRILQNDSTSAKQ